MRLRAWAKMAVLLGGLGLVTTGLVVAAGTPYSATFDGTPSAPLPLGGNLASGPLSNWDIQIHDRNSTTALEPIVAQHGPDCSSPEGPNPTHQQNGSFAASVFQCNGHIMTALNSSNYGAIYLTPNVMADWSDGEAVISVDISTWRSSSRDWWDIWITPYAQNMAAPLEEWLPDLKGPPKTAIHIRMDQGTVCPEVIQNYVSVLGSKFDSNCSWWETYDDAGVAQSKATRSTFEVRITRTHLKVSIPGKVVWFDRDIPDLGFTRGVVQLGHHSYNPTKDCNSTNPPAPDGTCKPNTWHWDNVSISPSVPFTIIKADKRVARNNNEVVRFNSPAPANSFLRFGGIGRIEVSYNGGSTWVAGVQQSSPLYDWKDHLGSYWMPIPQGTQNVMFRFGADGWYTGPYHVQDLTIWSSSAPPATPSPTATATPSPTSTPTATPTASPSPTSTPTIAATLGASVKTDPISAGAKQVLKARVTLSASQLALVRVECLNSSGQVVYRKDHVNVSLTAGVKTVLKTAWKIPSNLPKGTYSVRVSVYQAGGSPLIGQKANADTFTVR